MNTYTPRRASIERWLKDAPPYILDCFDSKGEGDRYTVFLCGDFLSSPEGQARTFANCSIPYLGMNAMPSHPQFGISMMGEMSAINSQVWRKTQWRYRVRWTDLPENIRNHIIARCKS